MTTLEEIEEAVRELPDEQLAKFRAWFEDFSEELFDRKIEQAAQTGKLDKLAEQALADDRAGLTREL